MTEMIASIPSTLTMEERKLKEMFDKLRKARKAISTVSRNQAGALSGMAGKVENRANRKSIEQAEVTTEEVKKKIKSGIITVKKVDGKQTFKRANTKTRFQGEMLKKFSKQRF